QVTLAGDRGAVHQVDIVFASGAVSPQDVGPAIAVEIAHAGHLPGRVGLRTHGTLAGDRRAVHQLDIVFASRAVSPQDVGLAIAVEVALAGHLPVLVGLRTHGTLAGDRRAVHQPDIVFASRAVSPQDVGPAIAVEIGARDMKGGLGDLCDEGGAYGVHGFKPFARHIGRARGLHRDADA